MKRSYSVHAVSEAINAAPRWNSPENNIVTLHIIVSEYQHLIYEQCSVHTYTLVMLYIEMYADISKRINVLVLTLPRKS